MWACLVLVAVAAGSAYPMTAAQKCSLAKQKAAAKFVSDRLKCNASAVKKGVGLDPECLTKAGTKFDDAFTKAEADGQCVEPGSATLVRNGASDFVSFVQSATSQPPCGFTSGFLTCGGSCPLETYCRGIDGGLGIPIACQCQPL